MAWSEIIAGTALAVVLFGLAGFTLWWQLRNLRQLAHRQLPDEETRYLHRQAWQRLATGGLLLVLGVLLVGALAFLENPAQKLADLSDEARKAGQPFRLTPEQRLFAERLALVLERVPDPPAGAHPPGRGRPLVGSPSWPEATPQAQ